MLEIPSTVARTLTKCSAFLSAMLGFLIGRPALTCTTIGSVSGIKI